MVLVSNVPCPDLLCDEHMCSGRVTRGENEVKSGTFALKNQETGEQVSAERGELAGRIQLARGE